MTTDHYTRLVAERGSLQRLLSQIPDDQILDRCSLQARLDEVEQELASISPRTGQPVRAHLTFRGRPVVGQHGVFAEFGLKATASFTDAVARIAAAISGEASSRTAIRHRPECRLLITGTALGSFGFELEEAVQNSQPENETESLVAQALELTQNLLRATVGTDEELADSAAATDSRAVAAVRSFLDLLVSNDAVCGLQCLDRDFQYRDVQEVRRGVQRLSQENLIETEVQLEGEFCGVLPKARSFEFRIAETKETIRGRIGASVSWPEEINRHLNEPMTVSVQVTRAGTGRPRYLLLSLSPGVR